MLRCNCLFFFELNKGKKMPLYLITWQSQRYLKFRLWYMRNWGCVLTARKPSYHQFSADRKKPFPRKSTLPVAGRQVEYSQIGSSFSAIHPKLVQRFHISILLSLSTWAQKYYFEFCVSNFPQPWSCLSLFYQTTKRLLNLNQ